MSITKRQISTKLDDLIEAFIKKGKLPPIQAIQQAFHTFMERIVGGPSFRPIRKERNSNFDVEAWNQEMERVEFDLGILYDELVEQAISVIKRVSWADIAYRSQRDQIERIQAKLDDVMFAMSNAEDYYLGITDPLTDYSRVDLSASTEGVLNLAERAIMIPPTPTGYRRVKMNHMVNSLSPKINILLPNKNQIIASTTAVDSPFSNIFHDISQVWRHDVTTRQDTPVRIQFTFPMKPGEEKTELTRIVLVPSTENKVGATILWSADGVNYTILPGGAEELLMSNNSRQYAIDFEKISARFIRVELWKDGADEEVGSSFRTSLGLSSIGLFTVERATEATYQTKVLRPPQGYINAVALDTENQIPLGCTVDCFLSPGTGEFQQVAPLGEEDSRLPHIVQFGLEAISTAAFSATGELHTTENGISFYSIYDPVSGELIEGTAKLYRGLNAWNRETNTQDIVESIKNAWVDFSSSDSQFLSTYITETVSTFEDLKDDDGATKTVLTTEEDVYYEFNRGHLIHPTHGEDIATDTQPKYAVAKVLAIRSDYEIEGEAFTLNLNLHPLTYRNIDEQEPYTVTDTESNELTEWSDYWLARRGGEESDLLSGYIRATTSVSTSALISYSLRKDITHLVQEIRNGNKIWLECPISADQFMVTYRTIPSNIVRPSVKVKERYGDEDPGIIFKEGSDYSLDTRTGRITRMAGGRISLPFSVYVDFRWIRRKVELETYSAWCFVSTTDPTIIEFSAPSLDRNIGERFYLDIPGGRADLTEAIATPPLTRGWHKFTVISKTIEMPTSGIRKVLALQDYESDPIFAGSKYFSELRSSRVPMTETNISNLKFGLYKTDRSKFAFDVAKQIVVNFQPGNTTDLTTYYYDADLETLVLLNEQFELEYKVHQERRPDGVRLKFILRREISTDPGTTPKITKWAIRTTK